MNFPPMPVLLDAQRYCIRLVLTAVLVLACLPQFAKAQNAISGGAISGVVTDPSGALVNGAKVTMANESTGVQQTTQTNNTGFYSFPFVLVGSYSLSFEQSGFQKTSVNHVIVQIGQTTSQNISLKLGSTQESVSVTASTPLLRPTDSSISTVVNDRLIEELPLSGRRYTDFVLLTPNVNADGEFGLVSVGGQQGGADSGYANGNGSNSRSMELMTPAIILAMLAVAPVCPTFLESSRSRSSRWRTAPTPPPTVAPVRVSSIPSPSQGPISSMAMPSTSTAILELGQMMRWISPMASRDR